MALPKGTENEFVEVIRNDPQIQARISRVLNKALDEIERQLVFGSPEIRMQAVKNLSPAITKSLESKKNEKDEKMLAMREQMDQLFEDMRQ